MGEFNVSDYRITRASEVAALTRRTKMFAALGGLPAQQRAAIAKAVTIVSRDAVARELIPTIRFSVTSDDEAWWLECIVSLPRAADSSNEAVGHPADPALDRIDGVDRLDVRDWPCPGGSVVIRQMTGPSFVTPTRVECEAWKRVLSQRSAEDALMMIRQHGQLGLAAASDSSRVSDDFGNEDTHAETRSLLSLVARGTDNFVAILNARGVITWVNDAFTRMTGYAGSEAENQRLEQLLAGSETNQAVLRDCADALKHGYTWSEELELRRRDGRTFWTHCTTTPIQDESGVVTRWIVIGTDVTRQRGIVRQLAEAKASAEAASQSKSEFLANMSHEIRTPLNAIIGMTDLSLGTELSRDQRDYLTTVKLSAESLLDLLNDVLDLSKIESGRLTIHSTDFNLADLIRDVLRALAVRAHVKGLELLVHMSLDVPQWLEGDPVRLRQILVNLIGNAIKFTDAGEVVLRVEQQWSSGGEVSLHFTVSDSGVGIPAEKLEQIFEAFEQADTSITREFGGTGLGLAISARLLSIMGGRIWVNSEPGQGSHFHFSMRFPVVDSPPMATTADAGRLAGLRVLVVDDSPANRRILQDQLRTWDMHSTPASSGAEALSILEASTRKQQAYDLLLLDGMMPEMDGFEVAEAIHAREDIEVGTVMMLSSVDRPQSAACCREIGVSEYLLKPVSPSTLLARIVSAFSTGTDTAEVPRTLDPVDPFGKLPAPSRALRILVADDHETNRVVAMRILQKRGHACDAAENGHEAAALIAGKDYDAVLMDVQMPVCDGLEATVRIRAHEQQTNRHVPIIAMTAHAMHGDREKCLAAGMDEYLAKPLDAIELVTMVERATGIWPEPGDKSNGHAVFRAGPDCTARFSGALRRMAGDMDLLRGQMESFLEDGPHLVDELAASVSAGDPDVMARAAHRLKSLLAGFDRTDGVETAQLVELAARSGDDLSSLTEHSDELRSEVELLGRDIREFLCQYS